MPENENVQIARRFIAAFDTKSWNDFADLTTPDVVYDEKPTQRRTEGAGQMVEVFQGWAKAFPDAKGRVTSCFCSGDSVALEVTWIGVHSGALTTASGTLAPSGKPIALPAAYFITLRGGKVREARQYFDLGDLLRQVGAAPKKP